jgi:hypothetical protein
VIVGVISDTHGLLRPEAVDALRGADRIIHAGDIGGAEILEALARLAPIVVVRGNNDRGAWAAAIPETAVLETEAGLIYVLHDRGRLDPGRLGRTAAPGRFRAVVAGHSHKPLQDERDGVLHFNPGSAGPRRFRFPISVGRLIIEGGTLRAELVTLG